MIPLHKIVNQKNDIFIPAIAGTTAMTVFSYLVSRSKKRNFREPEVLGQLIKSLPMKDSKDYSHVVGWSTHYGIGILFMVFYNEFWKRNIIKPSVTSGAMLGAASGLVGIIGWRSIFEIHPHPPAKNLKRFFGHLLLAHVVFGVFCSLVYKVVKADRYSRSGL